MLQTAQLLHAGSIESVARGYSTDVPFGQNGTQSAPPSAIPRRPALPPPGVENLKRYYGVPEQEVLKNVEGLGVAFIHKRTGKLYVWLERTKKFIMLDGWTYRHLLAPEYVITTQFLGVFVDTRLPDLFEDLPRDGDLPNRLQLYSAFGDGSAKKLGTVFGAAGVCKADSLPMEVSDRFREGGIRVRQRGGGTLFAEDYICMVESGEESTYDRHALPVKSQARAPLQGSPAKHVG